MGGHRTDHRRGLRLRKIITQVIVFLILGAIVTVAVAWVALSWRPWPQPGGLSYSGAAATSLVESYVDLASWPATEEEIRDALAASAMQHGDPALSSRYTGIWYGVRRTFGFAWRETRLFATCRVPDPLQTGFVKRIAGLDGELKVSSGGWPYLAFALVSEKETGMPGNTRWAYVAVRPLLPGVLVNTVFYAAILWLSFAAPGMLRRHIRKRRGHCIQCGYDLRGQLPGAGPAPGRGCPECGWNRASEGAAGGETM